MQIEYKIAESEIAITGLLQVIFFMLKLHNVINWTWLVVLIPLWINLGLIFIVATIWIFIITSEKR